MAQTDHKKASGTEQPAQPSPDRLLRKGLRLTHLRLLAALEETGQMSGAAGLLAISQPAASRLAAELEEIAGVKLYERHARGVSLTPHGNHLARRARSVFRVLQEADREIAELKSGLIGHVRIGAVTDAALQFVLPAIRQARVSHPKVDISVDVDTSDALIAGLDAGRLDFFLGRIPVTHDARHYDSRLAHDEPVVLVVRDGHPLTRLARVTLADCVEYDWVMQPRGALLRRTVESYLASHGIAMPQKVLNTSSMLLTLAAVSQTNAIAPLARSVKAFFRGEGGAAGRIVRLPVAEDLAITPYSLTKPAGHDLTPAARLLYDLISRRL